jgi:predicted nucleic acid-binding protein
MNKLATYLKDKSLLKKEGVDFTKDVLVDADALVALAKTNDFNHKKAVKISKNLQKKGIDYCFSPFTIAKAATVLSYKASQQSAKKFLNLVRKINIPALELTQQHKLSADKWFLKQKVKGASYFDCYNMALLDRYKNQLEAIFSFDAVYKKNGFTLAKDLKFQ